MKNVAAIVLGIAVIGGLMVWSTNRPPEKPVATNLVPVSVATTAPVEIPDVTPAPTPEKIPVQTAQKVPQLKKAKSGGGGEKPPIQDPDARAALGMVGMDPDAEAYWVSAINDPSLGPTERQDLIEDLNEDGLSDPKHPGPEDMPLIMNRLALIEDLAPYAMDQVNADAFAEAHKDLMAMLNGEEVQ